METAIRKFTNWFNTPVSTTKGVLWAYRGVLILFWASVILKFINNSI